MPYKFTDRYDPLVNAILQHCNVVNNGMNDSVTLRENVVLTVQEWIVTELIVQQREEYNSMVELSRMIGIPPSSFFRIVSHLQKMGFIDKYRVHGNKKNIILRPTELALSIYEEKEPDMRNSVWGEFYKELDQLSDRDIKIITNAFNKLTGNLPSSQFNQELELVKIE